MNISTRSFGVALLLLTAAASAAPLSPPLKVRIMPDDERKAYLVPHFENWKWKAASPSANYAGVTITLAAENGSLSGPQKKALLESGLRMGCTGIASEPGSGQIVLTITGLPAGPHTLATYHHEIRDKISTDYEVTVNGQTVLQKFTPSRTATSDYDLAATFFPVTAEAGKPLEVRFKPLNTQSACIINGLEIDASDPRKKAIKPAPANDDEHADPAAGLAWTAPAGAKTHQLFFGTDAAAVEGATLQSPEHIGSALKETRFALAGSKVPAVDPMKTYFWRVDEVDDAGAVTKGEVWRMRPRSLAFPTAEGYGRFARGGRGGRVIEVTTLEDYAANEAPIPGSYRAAIEATGPRTIVFRVSGVIQLKRECPLRNGYVTIAGQTAPGDGICIANYSAGLATNDAIVRFLRVRVGDKARRAMDGLGLGGSDNAIIDHCSISWSMDEGTSSRGGQDITFQWNIISEGLQHAYHYNAQDRTKFETHAFAGSISGNIGSYHHNLLAHNTDRNWSLAGGYDQAVQYSGLLDIRNNVVYNWTARTTDGGVKQLNYVNNYYKPYPQQRFVNWLLKLDPVTEGHGPVQYYMVGNVMEGFDYDQDNWKAFFNGKALEAKVRVNEPIFPSYVKEETAREAYPRVLANAGAIFPKRDAIDTRVVDEVKNGTVHYQGKKGATWNPPSRNFPGIIDTQDDTHDADDSPIKPWPNYKTYDVPADTDHDGMPDAWESAHGLDPKNPEDRNGDYNHDGYTNLEKYLNSLTGEYKTPPNPAAR